MNYPLISDYIEAIQAAEENFEKLKDLRPVLDDEGQPIFSSGNFAVVFKMRDNEGKFYAVKCFLKEQEGRAEAYRLIDEELQRVDSPYLTSIHYLDKELFVDTSQTTETEFPVLLMDWVEGKTLDKYLRENLDDKYALEMLAYRFSMLAQWLIPQPFAHGDLKPDNILVQDDGSLVLVDYDGMYVPAMKGQKARELGSPDFRHPSRTEDDFDEHIDEFPIVSILLSLKAISISPQLLDEYGASDRLLFSKGDYQDIQSSKAISGILGLIQDTNVLKIYTLFLYAHSQKVILLDNVSSLEIEVSLKVIYDYAKHLFEHGNEKDAFIKWEALARKGMAEAQNAIGVCYLDGCGVEQNQSLAIQWFESAANQDYISSIYNLGQCYKHGDGVRKDEHMAFMLFKRASKLKSEEAYYQLFCCYLKGIGAEIDNQEALKWLKKATKKKHPASMYQQGKLYEKGSLVEKDERKALLLYKKAANKEYLPALRKLGDIYRLGTLGGKISNKKSFMYYLKAATLGDASSQFYIGTYYAKGLGAVQNHQKAVEWYTRSAEQNNPSALNNLAVCYEHGRGVEMDLICAWNLFNQAATFGSKTAKRNLETFSRDIEKQRALSKEYLKKHYYNRERAFECSFYAAKQNDIESQRKVAWFYYLGFGVQKSYEESLLWIAKSIKGGDVNNEIQNSESAFSYIKERADVEDPNSQFIIGKCFEKGIVVEKDQRVAVYWFEKAANQGFLNAYFKLKYFKILRINSSFVKEGQSFENWISCESNLHSHNAISCLLNFLSCIKVSSAVTLKLHLAQNEPDDNTWLYAKNEYDRGKDLWKYLKVNNSERGVWQISLLNSSLYVMPSYDHGYYINRRYIYSEEELLSFLSSDSLASHHYSELKDAVRGLFISPLLGKKGNIGIVSRCYWNYWRGLIRENIMIKIKSNKVIEIIDLPSSQLCSGFFDVLL